MGFEGPASESDEVDEFIWRVMAEDGKTVLALLRTRPPGYLVTQAEVSSDPRMTFERC